jgi:phosphate transport system protein
MLYDKINMLKKNIIEYATLVENMVDKSTKGLVNKNMVLLDDVLAIDEPKANIWEMEIDETCTNMIAQFQPAAKDLRTILMVFKINNDLERIGDHAVNIAQSAQYLIERPIVKPFTDTPKMSDTTKSMLRDSINAFINSDAALAKSVCERDDIVDDLKNKLTADLTAIMQQDPSTIERALHILRITSNLERIADLSTNIGEDVLFMVNGEIIKHHKQDDVLPK